MPGRLAAVADRFTVEDAASPWPQSTCSNVSMCEANLSSFQTAPQEVLTFLLYESTHKTYNKKVKKYGSIMPSKLAPSGRIRHVLMRPDGLQLEATTTARGAVFGYPGPPRALRSQLGALWDPSWAVSGPFGARVGPVWGPFGGVLGPVWGHLGPFGVLSLLVSSLSLSLSLLAPVPL